MGKEKIRGFTLVEILVALTIIGIISSFSIVQLTQGQARARDTQRKTDLQQLAQALESYYNDNGRYVNGDTCLFYEKISLYTKTLKTPVDPKFRTDETPACPDAEKFYYYQTDDNGASYRLFTRLENCSDPQVISKETCSQDQYNYTITSGNIASLAYGQLPPPPPTVTPTPTSSPTPTPTTTPTPTPLPKYVFLHSQAFNNGNLGGLSGADSKCQSGADIAGLVGVWKAWLSDATTSASDRLEHAVVPYKLLDGKLVANNWSDLTDGTLANVINVDQYGTLRGGNLVIWTGTNANGSKATNHCDSWTSGESTISGQRGGAFGNDNWTEWSVPKCDAINHRLYCFEQ